MLKLLSSNVPTSSQRIKLVLRLFLARLNILFTTPAMPMRLSNPSVPTSTAITNVPEGIVTSRTSFTRTSLRPLMSTICLSSIFFARGIVLLKSLSTISAICLHEKIYLFSMRVISICLKLMKRIFPSILTFTPTTTGLNASSSGWLAEK